MKRIIAITIFVLASFALINSAIGQNHRVRATIPFNFIVGSKYLPAGTYTITSQDLVSVVVRNGNTYATVMSSSRADDARTGAGKLVFYRHGDQYILHRILSSYASMNLELPVSTAKKIHQPEMAVRQEDGQNFVALNK